MDAAAIARRAILVGWLLASASSAVSGDGVSIVAPTKGEVLIGEMTLRAGISGDIERVDFFLNGRLLGTAVAPDWSLRVDLGRQPVAGALIAIGFRNGHAVANGRTVFADLGFIGEIDVVAVQLYPVVTNRFGKFVRGLRREDFEVFDRGRLVEIDSFSNRATSLSLALAIDVSASMEDSLTLVQEAAVRFLSELDDADEVSVYGFNHSLQSILTAASDRGAAQAAVRSLSAGGGTALYDSLIRVIGDLDSAVSGRRALVVFSDGQDERSLAPLTSVVERARIADVLIYAIGAGDNDRDLAARDDLRALAEESGGEVHFVEKFKEIPGMFARIAEDLRAQYSLGFVPTGGITGVRPIEVRVRDRSLRVRCRRSYYFESTH